MPISTVTRTFPTTQIPQGRGLGGSYYIAEVQFDLDATVKPNETLIPVFQVVMGAVFAFKGPGAHVCALVDGGANTLANGAGQGLTMGLSADGTEMVFRNGVTGVMDTPVPVAGLRATFVVLA